MVIAWGDVGANASASGGMALPLGVSPREGPFSWDPFPPSGSAKSLESPWGLWEGLSKVPDSPLGSLGRLSKSLYLTVFSEKRSFRRGETISKPSGGGTGKSRTKPLNHQLGDVRLKVLSMS